MVLKELIFDSLESLEAIHIDYGKYTKELTPELYDVVENIEVENWYLDVKEGQAVMVVKLDPDEF